MQKLIFRNGAGTEIDLTSGNFGITEWEGFSADSLNIQSQQVPFQDGAVFLDALMEQRELSVTVAMQDNNNLEKRYELRRQMISIMNPKLGEGVLIYTNDFLSKQIHVIPQLPVFQNKNSNDSGTPKASCSFTACNPYWEDLEDTEVTFQIGEQPIIKNEGDIPTQIEMDWFTNYVKNGRVTNVTKNQMIQYDGDLIDNLKIDTRIGKKSVITNKISTDLVNIGVGYDGCVYSKNLQLFVMVGVSGVIITSKNGVNWESQYNTYRYLLSDVTYSEELNLFIAVGVNGTIVTSEDGITWTSQTSGISTQLNKVIYHDVLELFIAVGSSGVILTSSDAISWTAQTSGVSVGLSDVVYSDNLIVVVGGSGTILSSLDCVTWAAQTSGISVTLSGVEYSDSLEIFIAVGSAGTIVTSEDGENWEVQANVTDKSLYSIIYSDSLGLFIICGDDGVIEESGNSKEWDIIALSFTDTSIQSIAYSKKLDLFVATSTLGKLAISKDGKEWVSQTSGINSILYDVVYSEKLGLFVIVGYIYNIPTIITSPDGINWTQQTISISNNIELRGITYSEQLNLFVIVGTQGTILTSSDGINWTSRTSGVSVTLSKVCYSDNLEMFCAVGLNGTIITSEDSITWTTQTSGVTEHLYGITYSEEKKIFCTVGNNGTILTSVDGIEWQSRKSGLTTVINRVAYSPKDNAFVAVGGLGNVVISFNDGQTWDSYLFNTRLSYYTVIYSSKLELYLIGGDSGFISNFVFSLAENRIQYLSADSDIGMNLAIGDNKFRINKSDGNMVVRVKYRQKYIGV